MVKNGEGIWGGGVGGEGGVSKDAGEKRTRSERPAKSLRSTKPNTCEGWGIKGGVRTGYVLAL